MQCSEYFWKRNQLFPNTPEIPLMTNSCEQKEAGTSINFNSIQY